MCEFSMCWVTDRHFVRLCCFLKGPANLFSLLSPYSLGVKPGFYGSCSEWKHPLSGIYFFFCASAAATEHWTCFAFLHRQPPHNYVSHEKKKTNIVIALSYIYAESWEVSSAHFFKAFSQCSTALVCLGKSAFNIHHQRLQAVNVQLEALTLCPAAPLDFTKAHFFQQHFVRLGASSFRRRTTQASHFETADLPECPPQNQINMSLKRLWSCAPEGHSCLYLKGWWEVDPIFSCFFLRFVCLSPAERTEAGHPGPNVEMRWITLPASCCLPSSSVASSHSPSSSSLCFCLAGRCFAFRGERGNDEPPIEMIKVSHLKWVFSAGRRNPQCWRH